MEDFADENGSVTVVGQELVGDVAKCFEEVVVAACFYECFDKIARI